VWSSDEVVAAQVERETRRPCPNNPIDADTYARLKAEKSNGLVCVVIPNYNYGAYVGSAIMSAIKQTRRPDEIIIVDDASTDNSIEVINASIEQADKAGISARLIQHDVNSGTVGASRNTGISATICEYIVCLDSDDMIEPLYIETLLNAIKSRPDVGVVYSGVRTLEENEGNAIRLWENWPPLFNWGWMTTKSETINNCIPVASMFRREMWHRAGGYDAAIRSAEDVDFWLRGLSLGFDAVKVTSEPLFTYRRHGASMSTSRRPDNIRYWQRAYDGYKALASPCGEAPTFRDYTHPLISVIIPVGPSHAALVKTALYSLDAQTYKNFEIIVVDDTDQDIAHVVRSIRPYVRVISDGNSGVSAARNKGIEAARGKLVLFLDADDYLAADALEVMLKTYLGARGGYVYAGWHIVGERGEITSSHEAPQHHTIDWMSPSTRGMHPVTVLMPTEHARRIRFDIDVPVFEDWDFFARCAMNALWGTTALKPLLFYRATTGARRKLSEDNINIMRTRVKERYEPHIAEVMNMGCCGNTEPIESIYNQAYDPAYRYSFTPTGKVLYDYIGDYAAPVFYFGKYQAYKGCPPIEVDPGDKNKIESTGVFVPHENAPTHEPALMEDR
jgi:glycosyltransferase involved in cell wall biosynthesis